MDSFLYMCKQIGLDKHDMQDMTIGMCLDYLDESVEQKKGTKEKPVRSATQKDFDQF